MMAVLVLAAFGCNRAEEAYQKVKEKARVQGNASTALQEMGAKVEEKAYPRGRKAWTVDLSGLTLNDETFNHLRNIGHITELNFSKTNLSDAQLDIMNDPEFAAVILKLDLSNTAITDAGLEKLTKLSVLGELNLTGTHVTPAGIERFRESRKVNQAVPVEFRELKIEF
jgi:hypothetical protein